MDRIESEVPDLFQVLEENEICLEVLLASPLMTLFANLLNFSEVTHIFNMFMLDGETFIMDLIMNVYQNMKEEVIKRKDDEFAI
jgi:hypothetical protein